MHFFPSLPWRALVLPWLAVSTLHAAEPGPAKSAAAPGGDPFVKGGGKPDAGRKAPPDVMIVQETYSLHGEDALAVLDGATAGAERYQQVTALVREGKARLAGLTALADRSGTAAVTESIDEVRYATAFSPPTSATPKGLAVPKTFECRNTDQTLEVEASVSADGKGVHVNLTPQQVSLLNWDECPAWPGSPVAVQPRFSTKKVATSVFCPRETPVLLATYAAVDDPLRGGSVPETEMVFLRAHVLPVGSVEPDKNAGTDIFQERHLTMEYSFYTLARPLANDVVNTAGPEHDAPWTRLQALVKEGKAKCSHVSAIGGVTGQKATIEEIDEVIYGTQFSPPGLDKVNETTTVRDFAPKPAQGKDEPAKTTVTTTERELPDRPVPGAVTGFEKRNTGLTIEMEPLNSSDGGTILLSQQPQEVRYLGNVDNRTVPPQPLFETRKISSSLTLSTGKHILVGTFNPPGANGVSGRKEDDGLTTLVFVRATPGE